MFTPRSPEQEFRRILGARGVVTDHVNEKKGSTPRSSDRCEAELDPHQSPRFTGVEG